MPEHQQTQQSKKPDTIFQKQATPVIQTPVSNPYSIIQRAKINPKSLTHADIMQLQRTIGNQAVGRLLSSIGTSSTAQQATVQRQEISEEEKACPSCMQRQEIPEEEEPLQGKMAEAIQRQEIPEEEEPLQGKMIETVQRQEIPKEEEPLQGKFENKPEIACPSFFVAPIVQRQELEEEEPLQTKRENNTGMPDNLKAGVENLSGIDMSDVRVQYNSSKPAEAGALAYTQGTDIHVASGQEKHLPHEAWHVVQQKQGRVKPTMQAKGLSINDDKGLEHEADMMGMRAGELAVGAQSTQRQEEEELQTRPDPMGSFDTGSDIESRLGRPVVQRLMSAADFKKNTQLRFRKGKSAVTFAILVHLLGKYEHLPVHAQFREEKGSAGYIPVDVENKIGVLDQLLYFSRRWLALDASQTSRRRPMVTQLESEIVTQLRSELKVEEIVYLLGKYESLPAYAPSPKVKGPKDIPADAEKGRVKGPRYIPADAEKGRVKKQLLDIVNRWLASDAGQKSSIKSMVTQLKNQLEYEATTATTIANEEAAHNPDGQVPWVEYGNIYLSVTETGQGSWESIIKKRFIPNPETEFSIFSGTHGEANGYEIKDGLIHERHLEAEMVDEDSKKAKEIKQRYKSMSPHKKSPTINIIDVKDLRNPGALKERVKKCSVGNKVAILAWCYSVTALTEAKNDFLVLNRQFIEQNTNFWNSLNNYQREFFTDKIQGKDSWFVDSILLRNKEKEIQDLNKTKIKEWTTPPKEPTPPVLEREKKKYEIQKATTLEEGKAPKLEELLDTMLKSRKLYRKQKDVPIPDIMAKWV